MSKWIRTEDEKPESGKPVIACWSGWPGWGYDGAMDFCCWFDGTDGHDRGKGWERCHDHAGHPIDQPTHWMELPDAPTGFAPGWTPADGVEECHG